LLTWMKAEYVSMLNLSELPYLELDQRIRFNLKNSSPLGIVAVNGNLSPGVLLSAYRQGVFPWYDDDSPVLWWSPDPRFVLDPEKIHISKSMRKFIRNSQFSFSVDQDFPSVIHACAGASRKDQVGTWIVPEMERAYIRLHTLGYAHSVEVWHRGKLVGGLYGVSLGNAYFGESMFSMESNASKSAFILLVLALQEKGFTMIDCQVHTPHLESLGADEIPRENFLEKLKASLRKPTIRGLWKEWLDLEELKKRRF